MKHRFSDPNATRPLPSDDSPTASATQKFLRVRPLAWCAAGGAVAAFMASCVLNGVLDSAGEPRSFFGASEVDSPSEPKIISAEEWRAEQAEKTDVSVSLGEEKPMLPELSSDSIVPRAGETPLVLVEDANSQGTAWKGFVARSEDDKRKLQSRSEEDRLLREKRVLEDEKKRIERELEIKALQERFRTEEIQAQEARREEDRRRIQSRIDDDKRSQEESHGDGEHLAQNP